MAGEGSSEFNVQSSEKDSPSVTSLNPERARRRSGRSAAEPQQSSAGEVAWSAAERSERERARRRSGRSAAEPQQSSAGEVAWSAAERSERERARRRSGR